MATDLDSGQAIREAFNDSTKNLKVELSPTQLTIDAATDSIAIGDGTNKVTITDVAGKKAIDVNVVQTVGGGGGGADVQYADGATQATPTGTVALGKNGSNVVHALSLDSSGNLNVNLASGSISGGNGAASATGSPVPSQADYTGFNSGGNLVGVSSANPLPVVQTGTLATNATIQNASIAVTGPLTDTQLRASAVPVSASSLPLPSGAATSAKQPALGTAGTASSDVITVQGIASMTALKVDGSAVTQPVSGTVSVSGNVDVTPTSPAANDYLPVRLTDGSAFYTAGGGSGGGNAAASATGAAVPADADYVGYNSGGNLVGVSTANPLPVSQQGTVTVSGTVSISGTPSVNATLSAETTKVIGTVNVASGQSIAVTQATAANLNATVSGTVTSNIGTTNGLALDATLTGGTARSKITDGTNNAAVKAASTAAATADPALVVSISPNSTALVQGVQSSRSTGNITAANSVVGPFTASNYNIATITISGTYAGVSAIFEGTDDGTNWYGLQGVRTDSSILETGPTTLTNTTRAWDVPIGALTQIRVRATAWTSGTAVIGVTMQTLPYDPGPAVGIANLTGVGVAKGTQSAVAMPTQHLKDSGRTNVHLYIEALAGAASEALITLNQSKGFAAATTGTSYTVTAGKTLRITSISMSLVATTTTANTTRVRIRVNTAGAAALSSPIAFEAVTGWPSATFIANEVGTFFADFPDGIEIPAGSGVGVTHIEAAANGTLNVSITGFEY